MKIIWIYIIGIIAGCGHKSDTQKFIDYINDPDNKIIQLIKIGETSVTVKWLPGSYRNLVQNANAGNGLADHMSQEDDYNYFDVKFEKQNGDKPDKDKMRYLNFDMQNDFMLLEKEDSVMPAICQRIENGNPGIYEYIVAFEKPDNIEKVKNDFALIYKDKMFSIGTAAFIYRQKDILRIPKLKSTAHQ